MTRSVTLMQNAVVELSFNYIVENAAHDFYFLVTCIDGRTVSSTDAKPMIESFFQETARLHDRSLKLLESSQPKPTNFIVGKHRGRLG